LDILAILRDDHLTLGNKQLWAQMIVGVDSQPQQVSFDSLFCALHVAQQWQSTMCNGFADRAKFDFLSFASGDEWIPEIDWIQKELGQFVVNVSTRSLSSKGGSQITQPPRNSRQPKCQALKRTKRLICSAATCCCSMDGVGEAPRELHCSRTCCWEQKQETLPCVPFFVGNADGIFEKHRQFCERELLVFSKCRACGHGSWNNRHQKGAVTALLAIICKFQLQSRAIFLDPKCYKAEFVARKLAFDRIAILVCMHCFTKKTLFTPKAPFANFAKSSTLTCFEAIFTCDMWSCIV
jgi:hypothetical protein